MACKKVGRGGENMGRRESLLMFVWRSRADYLHRGITYTQYYVLSCSDDGRVEATRSSICAENEGEDFFKGLRGLSVVSGIAY